jgi:hypothetical protein
MHVQSFEISLENQEEVYKMEPRGYPKASKKTNKKNT